MGTLSRSVTYRKPLVICHGGATLTIRRLVNIAGGVQFEFISRPPGAFRIGLQTLRPSTTLAFPIPHSLRIHHGAKSCRLEFYRKHKKDGSSRRVGIHADSTWHVVLASMSPENDLRPSKAG